LKILIWPGSLRQGSLNRKLARAIDAKLFERGVETDHIDFRDYDMPLYDGDIEADQGLPAATTALAEKISNCDGLVLVTPEYNFGVPGPVKNAIDWMSRIKPYPTTGKTCFLASAAPGLVGGGRGLIALRPTLSFMGAWLVPDSFSLAQAGQAFGEDGGLVSEDIDNMLDGMLDQFLAAAESLKLS